MAGEAWVASQRSKVGRSESPGGSRGCSIPPACARSAGAVSRRGAGGLCRLGSALTLTTHSSLCLCGVEDSGLRSAENRGAGSWEVVKCAAGLVNSSLLGVAMRATQFCIGAARGGVTVVGLTEPSGFRSPQCPASAPMERSRWRVYVQRKHSVAQGKKGLVGRKVSRFGIFFDL